jgi:hypothetical protein
MTHPHRSLLRRMIFGVPAPLILMTASAGLLIILFQASNGTVQAVAGVAASILLFLVLILWGAIVINEAGRDRRDSKPLTQRWQAQRRARRARK